MKKGNKIIKREEIIMPIKLDRGLKGVWFKAAKKSWVIKSAKAIEFKRA